VDTENLETSLKSAFNSKPMQELRRNLSQGKLGAYCERALGCPIVKAHTRQNNPPLTRVRPAKKSTFRADS